MEQKFGHLGIPGLVRILAFFKLLTWILLQVSAARDFGNLLVFSLPHIYQGEIWRLVSFLILPASMNMIFIIFEIIFLLMIGDSLERAWSPFGVTLYYFSSAACGIIACLLLSLVISYPRLENMPIYASLIMAAGALFPNTIIQLYLIIPIKLKWIGVLAGFGVFWFVFELAGEGLVAFAAYGIPALACLIPFFIVFVPGFIKGAHQRSKVAARRSRFEQSKLPEKDSFHRCDRCGATETTHPDREFRITGEGEELCSGCRQGTGEEEGTPPSSARKIS